MLVVDQEGSVFLVQWLSLTAWLLSINYSCCKDQKTHPDVSALHKGVTGTLIINILSELIFLFFFLKFFLLYYVQQILGSAKFQIFYFLLQFEGGLLFLIDYEWDSGFF